MKNYVKYLAVLALGIISCEPEFDHPIEEEGFYSNGEADFSNYVALGNSLTAGYADNALYRQGQENSYPNILARQFGHVGGGEFTQPLMNDHLGGLLVNGSELMATRLVLGVDANGNPTPTNISGTPSTEITNTLTGPFNNMGVPGAKTYHLVAEGYGNVSNLPNANPYFVRFRSSENATVLGDAVAQNPTFFSLWIGNNDVLAYASSGGIGVDQTGNFDPSTYGANDITDPNVFASIYSEIVTELNASATGGVLLNIPSVTDTPYFTTVPYNPISPEALAGQIEILNGTYSQLNQAFAYLGYPERAIEFSSTEANPVVVQDESLTDISSQLTQVLMSAGMDEPTANIFGMQYGQTRQATEEDLLVLTSSSVIGQVNEDRVFMLTEMGVPAELAQQIAVNGVTYPLEDQYVLIPTEQEEIAAATEKFNNTIMTIAEANGLAFVDAKAMLNQVANGGISFDGGTITSEFATGGAFSLDGIHLTPRGYAVVANKIIEAVNEAYGSTVPQVNIGYYSGDPVIGSGVE